VAPCTRFTSSACGKQINAEHASSALQSNVVGLVVGLATLLDGTPVVTQWAEQVTSEVWSVPAGDWPRSLMALTLLGLAFGLNAAGASYATTTASGPLKAAVVPGLLHRGVLGPHPVGGEHQSSGPGRISRRLGVHSPHPVGVGLVQHQIQHASATYGQFGVVIGLLGFLFLATKVSLYGAALNPVLTRQLSPRHLTSMVRAMPSPARPW
jgi:hypothetical protein